MGTRIGRNERCPCGSGKKFKRCHADASLDAKETVLQERREEARALQQQQQQGLGRPIISTEFKGRRFVAVGNKLHNAQHWATFHDFLMDYGRGVLGSEWWPHEMMQPADRRHPVVQWFDLAQQSLEATSSTEAVRSRPMTGAAAAYLYL